MASYIALLQFTEQGVRNIKDTTKRSAATREMASQLGVKVVDIFWTLGSYDIVLVMEAPDDETLTAFTLKLSSLGNVKTQTLRAFRDKEMDAILNKVK
jgi:uncharacterized protein with GYD domain